MACEKFGNTVFDKVVGEIPESSQAQDLKAQKLFTALVEKNKTQVYQLIEVEVQDIFEHNPQVIPSVFAVMPDHVIEAKEVIYRAKTIDLKVGKIFSVTYLYEYPENPIKFTVVFKGHEGSDKVLGFFVNTEQKNQQTPS